MSDRWTERLSEYLDGELEATERVELEEHLRVCDDCIGTLRELRSVVARAETLEDRPPNTNLWSGIASRVGSSTGGTGTTVVDLAARRRFTFSIPQLLAAGIALMSLSGSVVWLAVQGFSGGRQAVVVEGPSPSVEARPVMVTEDYDETVAELEHVLEQHRDQLDPGTVEALEQSLAVIDDAIEEARAALAADPADAYLNTHLAETMRRKIHLLSRAAALARAAT